MIKEITTNQYFLLALTFGIYQGAKMLQRKTGSILLNPILIAIGLIILLLEAMDIPYETYYESGKMIVGEQIRHNTYRNGSYTVSRRYSFVDGGYSRNYGIDRWSSWFQDDVGRSYQ